MALQALPQTANELGPEREPEKATVLTLLELVTAVAENADNDREVVATITHLINSGQVRLIGSFQGADVRIR